MKKMNVRKAVTIVAISAVIIASLFLLQRLLSPKYVADVVEGALIAEYYDEVKDHDVVFIGDCEVYENVSPALLWQDYGINSYIRGSAQQLIWQSYYLLEDTLRYEKPDVVVFNVLSLKYNEPQNEAYNRMTLEGMKWSPSKVKSIKASMTEEENFLDYVFPILRYHSRITELTADDFRYMFKTRKVSHNGYYMRVDVKAAEGVPTGKILPDYSFGSNAVSYLDKMRELCENEGVQLVLMKAPSLYPYWYDEWEQQVRDYADKYGLLYVNYLELADEIGIDYSTDTYDGGLHMNLSGAEKLSHHLGSVLASKCNLESRADEKELSEAWKIKIADYEAERDAQTAALQK